MQKYANSVQDTNGNARSSASVTVYLTGTTTKATLYSDNAASPTPLANPVTTDTLGEFYFYAASGRYDLSISGTGFTTQSLTDIQLFDGPDPTGAANVGFSPTGTGALTTRTVQATLRALVRTGDFDTAGHFTTALAALTEGIGAFSLKVGDGTATNPSFAFASTTNTGFITRAAGTMDIVTGGVSRLVVDSGSQFNFGNGTIAFAAGDPASNLSDTKLVRDAANVFAQRNSTTTQQLRVYRTFTDASNYERFSIKHDANGATIAQEVAGTGVAARLQFETGGSVRWAINSSGVLFATVDNTLDIGTAGAVRPRTGYFGTSVITPLLTSTGGVQAFSATAIPAAGTAGTGFTFSSTSNFGVFFGSGAPTLSAAKGSLYLRSDGSGTTDRAYINTNGSTTWTALTTVA